MLSFISFLRHQAIAILALLLALTSTTYAVTTAAKNSVVSKSIKNGTIKAKDVKDGALTGAKVADDSLTGADIDESSLGRVPSAVAAQAGGLAFASPTGSCTPVSTTSYDQCTTMTFTVPTAAKLVLVGQAGISHRTDNQFEASGYCRYRVNGVDGSVTSIARNRGDLAAGWDDVAPLLDTALVPAGQVTAGIFCEDSYYSKFQQVKFVAILSAP